MAKKTKEEQQGRILPREAFDLVKLKFTKKGVDVTEWYRGNKPAKHTTEGDYQPHPDFKQALDQLQLHMASRLGLLEGWDFAREHLKKEPELLEMAMNGHKAVLKRMNVGGIQLVGSGETRGVLFTGSIEVPEYGSTGLTVPKISLENTVLGYEDDVEAIVKEISTEAYKYIHLNKKAQLEIGDGEQGSEDGSDGNS